MSSGTEPGPRPDSLDVALFGEAAVADEGCGYADEGHWANRRYTVCQLGPNTGGNCRQVQPEVATKIIAAKASRSPARRRPPPWGRFTSVGGTTRRNNPHNSSGTNSSTRSAMTRSPNDYAIRNDVLKSVLSGRLCTLFLSHNGGSFGGDRPLPDR